MAGEKYKIFIIDDDEFLLDMYAVKFRESGFEVEAAADARTALEKIKNSFHPDVILLDLVMPGMDGFDFLKTLQKEHLAEGCRVVILSNVGQKEDIDKGFKLGAKDYIIKAHHTPSEVVAKVKAILK